MTTFAALVTAIQGMSITGVDRHYDHPPESADLSDGECAFPMPFSGAREDMNYSCPVLAKTRNIEFVIIVDATSQGTNEQNYAKLATLADNLETALDALTPDTLPFINYDITTTGNYEYSGFSYWAIVASIDVRDA